MSLAQLFKQKFSIWSNENIKDESIKTSIEQAIDFRLKQVENFKKFHQLINSFIRFIKNNEFFGSKSKKKKQKFQKLSLMSKILI